MIQEKQKFVSYIESRIEENNNLYARFHLGSFVSGQALTIANALRRTLLAEIPAFIITHVEIEGTNHEFATLPGIYESVLNIVLNLKKIVLIGQNLTSTSLLDPDLKASIQECTDFKASLHARGPQIVSAKDIKFPTFIAPLIPSHHIATLSSTGELKFNLTIEYADPLILKEKPKTSLTNLSNELILDTIPKPVKQVNFGIHKMPTHDNEEYISLEIWTDGSIAPKAALGYALEKLTRIFYEFTTFNRNSANSIF